MGKDDRFDLIMNFKTVSIGALIAAASSCYLHPVHSLESAINRHGQQAVNAAQQTTYPSQDFDFSQLYNTVLELSSKRTEDNMVKLQHIAQQLAQRYGFSFNATYLNSGLQSDFRMDAVRNQICISYNSQVNYDGKTYGPPINYGIWLGENRGLEVRTYPDGSIIQREIVLPKRNR